MFRPVQNTGPSTATPGTSSSRSTHPSVAEAASRSRNDAFASHTSAAPTFQRPRRFLLLAREKLEPAVPPPLPAARVTSRSRIVDSMEPDFTPTESAIRDGQQNVPQSRGNSNPGPSNHPVASAAASSSRIVQQPIPPSRRASVVGQVDSTATASFSSRITQRPIPRTERNSGPADLEPRIISSSSANRGSRPFPLPQLRNAGSVTTTSKNTPAAHAAYQAIPRPARHNEPTRTPVTSTSRAAQQSMHQPTRDALPTHTSTSSATRITQQPTVHPPRTSTHALSASASRATQQSTFRSANSTAAPMDTPTSSASASILEFICLYTHDLRRKKKRWQDGKLKFHTFNKKYMVYDDGGGFVGDGHWQGDATEVAEGLEMNLDRGMAIVQLLECTGSKEQDLGEVLGKRAREVEERRVSAAAKLSSSAAPSNPAKRSRGGDMMVEILPPTTLAIGIPLAPRNGGGAGVAVAVETPTPTTLAPILPPPPRKRAAGVAMAVVQTRPTTGSTMAPLPPRNGGAWSTHAMDLMGITRPSRV
ncbi:hypothetical protein HDV57DRAFT_237636 [Trichoderma longibrachiatum]